MWSSVVSERGSHWHGYVSLSPVLYPRQKSAPCLGIGSVPSDAAVRGQCSQSFIHSAPPLCTAPCQGLGPQWIRPRAALKDTMIDLWRLWGARGCFSMPGVSSELRQGKVSSLAPNPEPRFGGKVDINYPVRFLSHGWKLGPMDTNGIIDNLMVTTIF